MRVFVTGASGWIGSAVVPELLGAGHQVTGLARSEASADALIAAGAEVQHGTLDDLDTLRDAAAASDGVIHLAFKHDLAFTGDFQDAADADRRAVETFGEVLAGSDRPFVIASGTLGSHRGGWRPSGTGMTPTRRWPPRTAAVRRPGWPRRRCALPCFPRRPLVGHAAALRRVTATGITASWRPWSPSTRDKGVSAISAMGPTAGLPCTGSIPRTSSAWRWRRPRRIDAARGRR